VQTQMGAPLVTNYIYLLCEDMLASNNAVCMEYNALLYYYYEFGHNRILRIVFSRFF